ncbi:high-affinity choline transporter 1-like [Callorhinchus milii]|uniref:High-affinity choline transporter 1-like n=1 Tax=Callorhinchus milii TaxID=7868 RepID=A0A4W3K2A4_CALMI|nr:high-affinity choline transporter 1-like [Callorhinchus milii]|eukprot:gi/632948281/ref/XP_007889504.1/ PREDICTED: high-affinity choline transporter 1-like [Callorhinchus milii]
MSVNIAGVVSVAIFYLLILAVGIFAAKKASKIEGACEGNRTEMAMIAGRKMGIVLGILTTTATWVGGAYINGTAEMVYRPDAGLVWTVAPWTTLLCMLISALFFAKKMRSQEYVTMLDPFQQRYGTRIASLLFVPAVISEIFWTAAILAALGTTSSVILGLDKNLSVVISSSVAMIYTLLGGLYSVAYTDVVQLGCIFIGLWLCVPFTLLNDAVTSIRVTAVKEVYQKPWIGKIDEKFIGQWIDHLLLMVLGGIPWQVYFQRVLASSSAKDAQILSIVGAFGSCIMGIPSVLIGSIAASTDWNQTSFGLPSPFERNEAAMILPIVLQYLCPPYISVFGIGAIAASVMSSTDSSLLSSSSMFTHNIYRKIFRAKASEKEILYVMRAAVVVVATLSTILSLCTSTIYGLYALSSDIVYVVLFPQLVCVLYVPCVTRFGFVTGILTGALLRLAGGEPLFHFPAVILYPGGYFHDNDYVQIFPFKTFAMLCSLIVTVTLSYVSKLKYPRTPVIAFNLIERESERRDTD